MSEGRTIAKQAAMEIGYALDAYSDGFKAAAEEHYNPDNPKDVLPDRHTLYRVACSYAKAHPTYNKLPFGELLYELELEVSRAYNRNYGR